jgi:ATP-dependent Clp protease ATP-binding subunit ClpC
LEAAQKRWEENTKAHRITVTEDHVAEVVSMMTGIPLQKVSESETGQNHAHGRRHQRKSNWPR